jgi:nucleoid-associated protein YgaU
MPEKDDLNKKGTPIKPGGIPSKSGGVPPKPGAQIPKAGAVPPKPGPKNPVVPPKAGIPAAKPPAPPHISKAPTPDVFDRSAPGFGAAPAKKAEPVYIAEHKVVEGETLSHIALKYYGSAVREKWLLIQEANQALLDEHKGVLLPGMILKIPELPKK